MIGTPKKQRVNAATRKREHRSVKRHDAEPFAEPDLPSGNRFRSDDLDLTLLDVTRERATREPQCGKAKETGNRGQSVGDQNLRETLRSAVVFNHYRQGDDSAKQENGDDNEETKAKRRFPGQSHHGSDSLAEY